MKIVIPKVVVPVKMAEYAPELAESNLYVWVNPSMEKLQKYNELVIALESEELDAAKQTLIPIEGAPVPEEKAVKEKSETALLKIFESLTRWLARKKDKKFDVIDPKLLEWYAEIWSQGPEETHWSVDELRKLESQDPTFLSWMIAQSWKTRSDHVERKKKA